MKKELPLPSEHEIELLDMLSKGMKAHHVYQKAKLPSQEILAVRLRELRVRYKAENTTHLCCIAVRNGWIK